MSKTIGMLLLVPLLLPLSVSLLTGRRTDWPSLTMIYLIGVSALSLVRLLTLPGTVLHWEVAMQ